MKLKRILAAVGLGLSIVGMTACDSKNENGGQNNVATDQITVTLNYGYDTPNETVKHTKGGYYYPAEPKREGYVFLGWYTDEALSKAYDDTKILEADTTLYAKWAADNVTITYNYNYDNKVVSEVVLKGALSPATPTREGDYIFAGWYTDEALTNKFVNGTKVTSSLTLYAKWEKAFEEVTYGFGEGLTSWASVEEATGTKENDGKVVLAKSYSKDDITLSSNNKNRINHDGDGNATSYNTQQAEITIVVKSKATIVVEGKWGSTTKTGKVYLKNGSANTYESATYQANTETSISDVSFTKEVEVGTYTLTSDATINISKLAVSRKINYVNVTYVSEHGTTPNAVKMEKGSTLTTLPEMSAEGFIFEGWYTDSNFAEGTKTSDSILIEANTTLYAKWKVFDPANYATVEFDKDIATETVNSITVEKGNKLTSLPTLSVEGYRFAGWYTDEALTAKFDINTVITASITLHAKFVQQRTVTFKYEDGTVIKTVTLDDDTKLSSVYIPTPNFNFGYSFDGWYDGTTKFDFETNTVVKNTVVVAKYVVSTTTGVEVMSAATYNEGLYVEYLPYETATTYNVYVKKSDATDYVKLDDQLTRLYKSSSDYNYYRTDALGLAEGSYSVKVVPVISNQQVTEAAAVKDNLTVVKHDRSGFGFVNGTSSGAYNDDGTLKSNARVIYVTNETKDTVETTAIQSKQTVTVAGVQNIITAMKSQKGISDPVCIRFIGNILDPANMPSGDLYVDAVKNLTLEGVGNDATLNGFGVVIKNSSNIEVRNLGFMNCNSKEGDDCGLQQDNDHVWVHNCDFFYGDAGSDADQAKGDGALDTKKSTYVTHSYNHFWDNGKCNLQGMKDETTSNYITYHHNWYDHSDSRHPRVRTCTVHIYNNYFDGNAKYGIASALGASIFAENNYFRSTTNTIPFMSGKMAHDIKDDGGNVLSGEAGGVIKEYGNVFEGNSFRYTKYQDNNTSFDAYQASSRDEVVPASVVPSSGTVYNNFDTNSSIMYTYEVESAEDAKLTVIANAGRVQGGDFKWTFTDADDSDYNVNQGLKTAIVNYKTNLISVQGVGSNGGADTPTQTAEDVVALIEALPESTAVTAANKTAIEAAKTAYDALDATEQAKVTNKAKLDACISKLNEVLNFGSHIKTFNDGVADASGYFTIKGNLKDGVPEKTYNGVKYTTAMKMESESKTSISFTCTGTVTLTIITDTASKKIKIDGTASTTDANGVVTIQLAAGTHTIIKGDSINVYAFIVE